MSHDQPKPVILDRCYQDFLQYRVTVNVSSRDTNNVPKMARGLGCRVSGMGRRVTVYVPQVGGRLLLQSLAGQGMIAMVCSRPSTHQTLQLKGVDARVASLDADDQQIMRERLESFLDELRELGYTDHFIGVMRGMADGGVAAVTFTPTAAFVQTPGPQAGQALVPAS